MHVGFSRCAMPKAKLSTVKLLDFQQIAKWHLKSGRKITILLRSLFAYPRFLFYADGFLDQMLGASFNHSIPQAGVLKFGHGNVLLETREELKRHLNIPVGDDFSPVYLIGKLFEQTPVVVDFVAIGECFPIPL